MIMSKTVIRKLPLFVAVIGLAAGQAQAQMVKTVSVSGDAAYTDHISLAEDARDMDVMVKFIFDEANNVLTVSVLSYRSLFVFREASNYNAVVRCNRLRPELLPYVAESGDKDVFRLSRQLRKSIPSPRCKYVFKRWIEYDGLQPVPTDYKMVNDYIEQSFDILQMRNAVTVTIRDLYLLDISGRHPSEYSLLLGKDLNTKYHISIQRNPCLGKEKELAASVKLCEDVRTAYESFSKVYQDGEVDNSEALKHFEETRTLLLTQFPPRQDLSDCPSVNTVMQQYNDYVDSISTFTCVVREKVALAWDKGLDVKMIYTQARQLDKAVARWLVSKDELERQDLVAQCRDIVQDVSAMIQRHSPSTPEEVKAVKVYNQAERYFKKTCKQ